MSQHLDPITRRRFVAGSLAAGAAAALPATTAADAAAATRPKRRKRAPSHSTRADVIVVGGGLAGLTTARQLVAQHQSVIVLEARDRVGGRVWNHDLGGGKVSERGGTFVGPTQDAILAMLAEFKIGTFPTYDNGDDVYINNAPGGPSRLTYSDTGPTGTAPPDPAIVPELTEVVQQLDQMSTTVPVDAPWTASSATDWDSQTLYTWIQNNSKTQRFQALVPAATRPIFGAEPRELSLLFTLFYIASSGDAQNPGTFERNFDTRGGAQQNRIIGGSQILPITIARQLGGRVRLDSPVRSIRQTRGGVQVLTDRHTYTGKEVVVAVPPALAGRIDYEPILPFQRDQLTQRFGQGTLTKVACVYPTPFWRELGLSGTAVDTGGPISASFDDSPPDGSPGVIFGFVGGDNARSYATMSPAARKQAVVNQINTWFQDSRALKPTTFFETTWAAEQWTRGCPVGIPTQGTLLAYGPWLRQPVGRIHWAGTETSDYWNGYMDGAIRSGLRVAAEVLAAL
jgi:monoamine oxidase